MEVAVKGLQRRPCNAVDGGMKKCIYICYLAYEYAIKVMFLWLCRCSYGSGCYRVAVAVTLWLMWTDRDSAFVVMGVVV